ncbi:unnamed protein product [Psylliodes chrysocephalus]|uniref:Uncharacterized protein n=1 Tax=Psylliodes chrysocephalus TaxID=3402493 RepID=A0A9P0D0L4_9CUCU|nr:unnamed protein product [Psylliodes chrysocephala]
MPFIFDNKPLYLKSESPKTLPYNDKIIIHKHIKILKPKTIIVEEKTEDEDHPKDDIDMKEQFKLNETLNILDQNNQDVFKNSQGHDSKNNDNDMNQNYFMLDNLNQNTDENLENIPESMSSKKTVESGLNCCGSEIIEKAIAINLEDFLPKAKTPERKNKNQIKKTSFVISSSAYKKEMKEKKKKKEALEHQKEENRQKRLKQKLEEQGKPKQTIKSKVDEKQPKQGKKSKTADTDCIDAPAEASNITKKHPNSEKFCKTETTDEVKNYVIKRTGLCFSCVTNITLNKIGIKCQDCNRVYHLVC